VGGRWEVEEREFGELEREEGGLMRRGEMGEAYERWVIRGNMGGEGFARFEDGLLWGEEGWMKLERRTLRQIIQDVVEEKGKSG